MLVDMDNNNGQYVSMAYDLMNEAVMPRRVKMSFEYLN